MNSPSSSASFTSTHAQPPILAHGAARDASWDAVDEGEEGLTNDADTDYDLALEANDEEGEEERSAAVVTAEEGRGLMVRGRGS